MSFCSHSLNRGHHGGQYSNAPPPSSYQPGNYRPAFQRKTFIHLSNSYQPAFQLLFTFSPSIKNWKWQQLQIVWWRAELQFVWIGSLTIAFTCTDKRDTVTWSFVLLYTRDIQGSSHKKDSFFPLLIRFLLGPTPALTLPRAQVIFQHSSSSTLMFQFACRWI